MSEEHIPDILALAEAVTQKSDWKEALDSVMAVVRSVFLFDNLSLYTLENSSSEITEIAYARAVGRGQSAGADAAWGAEIASRVIAQNELVVQTPNAHEANENRLTQPFVLGLPLRTYEGIIGAVVFVRFGGPEYTPAQIQRAQYIATQFSALFMRKKLTEEVAALASARRLLEMQEDFLATISHELRTPLGFIKGYTTTLLRKDTNWDEETRREFLQIIDEEADHLNELIENVLESARLQSNTLPMRFQPVRLDILIRDTMIRSQARYKNLQVRLDFATAPTINADSVRIAQVLENLFSNANKYAPGAPVSISLTQIRDFYRIRFSDAGPGIPAEYLPNLFQRFYRVPGQTGSGSGLGLFICKQIIEAHGGRISVESTLGRGTTFIIDLPIAGKNPGD
ncbi:MAG: HAMP domain-containing histidine kinase [Anaerolineales bacterium]|nr:HAMP domain-containing histidine kinase [Anaerolineales bacterium]MDW8279018.1 HAMP domain-containing sensor histidine kinase [Anaerolineales bacterium]